MSTLLDTLKIRIEVDASPLKRGMDDAARNVETGARRMNTSFAGVGAAFSKVTLGVTALAAAGVGLVAMAKQSIDAAGALGELADQLGISTDKLQTLQYAAVQSGVKVEALEQAVQIFTRRIGEAREGSDGAVKAVRAMGAEFERAVAAGADNDTLLRMFVDRIAGTADKSVAAARGADLMGRSFQRLLPMFSGGAKALDTYGAELERLGLKLTPEMIAKSDEASDAWARMQFQASALARTLSAEVAPAITHVIARLNDFITGPDISKIEKTLADRRQELTELREQLDKGMPRGVMEPAIARAEHDIAVLEKRLEAAKETRDRLEADLNRRKPPTQSGGTIGASGGGLVMDSEKKKAEEFFREQMKLEQQLVQQEKEATDQMRDRALVQWEIIAGSERELRDKRDLLTAMGQGVRSMEEEIEYRKIINQLKATGVSIDDQAIERARELAKEHVQVNREVDRQKAAMRELEMAGDRAFDRIGSAMTEMALEGKEAWQDWRNVGKAVISEIMQEFLKLSAINPLKNAIFNGNSPTLTDVFGKKPGSSSGIVEGEHNWMFDIFKGIPGFAEGGRPTVGAPSIVGERGPELFVPDVPGNIVPNHQLGKTQGGGPIFYVDNRGASVDAVARLERIVMRVQGSIKPIAISAVADARQRGMLPA